MFFFAWGCSDQTLVRLDHGAFIFFSFLFYFIIGCLLLNVHATVFSSFLYLVDWIDHLAPKLPHARQIQSTFMTTSSVLLFPSMYVLSYIHLRLQLDDYLTCHSFPTESYSEAVDDHICQCTERSLFSSSIFQIFILGFSFRSGNSHKIDETSASFRESEWYFFFLHHQFLLLHLNSSEKFHYCSLRRAAVHDKNLLVILSISSL